MRRGARSPASRRAPGQRAIAVQRSVIADAQEESARSNSALSAILASQSLSRNWSTLVLAAPLKATTRDLTLRRGNERTWLTPPGSFRRFSAPAGKRRQRSPSKGKVSASSGTTSISSLTLRIARTRCKRVLTVSGRMPAVLLFPRHSFLYAMQLGLSSSSVRTRYKPGWALDPESNAIRRGWECWARRRSSRM
jgi:hypothetical protein